jgi:heavy metal translocating P-type ATPase
VLTRAPAAGPLFCCYGCYLVSRIVGRQDGQGARAWDILRLSVGTFLAMDVMMIALTLYTGAVEADAAGAFRWIMLALATPAMAILVYPFLQGAAGELRRGRLSLDALIALGSLAAYGVSAANTIRGEGHVYFDTATMLPALVTFGKLIEATAKGQAGRLTAGIETLLPKAAIRLEADGPREVPVAELVPGDRIQVRPGERFAVDGRILEGATSVEDAAMTGESRPRACTPGDEVLAGTVNGPGAVVVRAERVGEALLVSRIVEMVDAARRQASPYERIAERVATVFVPAVLVLATAAGVAWLASGDAARAGLAALAVLVVACPCAMGIATSLATALAIGRAAREGVLVRGGDVLERIGRIGTVFFDKTGTLTAGRPTVAAVEALDGVASEDEVLAWLAGLESASEHTLARAVVTEARRRGIAAGVASNVEVVPGQGLRGRVTLGGRTREVVAGTENFVTSAASEAVTSPRWQAGGEGATVIEIAWDGRPRGRVWLVDVVRPDAAVAVRRLRDAGIASVLLSGDRLEAARAVAAQVGIAAVEAPRQPDEKVVVLRAPTHLLRGGAPFSPLPTEGEGAGVRGTLRLRHPSPGLRPPSPARGEGQRHGTLVAMVGDGINDAPALAAADVGIALGAGTDLARQAGHVVLLSDRLEQIPWIVALSRRTRSIIRQNLWWALGYNAIALAAAALGWLHPLLAAVAMVVSSLTVLGNSLRLRRFPAGQKAGATWDG